MTIRQSPDVRAERHVAPAEALDVLPTSHPTVRSLRVGPTDPEEGDHRPYPTRASGLCWRSKGVVVMMWYTGQWYWGVAMMLIFWGAIVALAIVVTRGRTREERPSARALLDERFAKGEVSQEEYERKRAVLEGRSAE